MNNKPQFNFEALAGRQSASVPTEALRFKVPLQAFAKSEGAAAMQPQPVKLVARSGQPIEHWYWGNVVHDLAGMRVDKPVLPIDYCHDCDQVLGLLNQFDITSGDLVCSGLVTPFTPDDRASEVIFKSDQGVPYEASINFGGDGIKVQYIADGEVTQVNGYSFEGPGIVIREWPLRGVAICPYGADSGTSTEFKGDDSPSTNITLFSEEHMDKKNGAEQSAKNDGEKKDATKSAAELAAGEKKEPAAATPPAEPKVDHAAFVKAFGDIGARWFLEGKSFSEATVEFVASQKTQHETVVTELKAAHAKELEAIKAQVAELTNRIAGTKLGNEAVGFQKGEQIEKEATKKFDGLSENQRKVASAIKMPGQKDKA